MGSISLESIEALRAPIREIYERTGETWVEMDRLALLVSNANEARSRIDLAQRYAPAMVLEAIRELVSRDEYRIDGTRISLPLTSQPR